MKFLRKIVDWFEIRQIKSDRKRRQDALDRRLEMALYDGRIEQIEQAMVAGARPCVLLQHYIGVRYGKAPARPTAVFREWLCRQQRVELPKKLCAHEGDCPTCTPQNERD